MSRRDEKNTGAIVAEMRRQGMDVALAPPPRDDLYRPFEKFTPDKWDDYLEVLTRTGSAILAADAVRSRRAVIEEVRRSNSEFRALCRDAMDRHSEIYLEAARTRAVYGWEEPIIGGRERDEVVGHVRKYSDRLLELFLKRYVPEFRESFKVDVSTEVRESQNAIDFSILTDEARAKLRALLEQIEADRERGVIDVEATEAEQR